MYFKFFFELLFNRDELHFIAKLAGYELDHFGVEALVDRHDNAEVHAGGNYLYGGNIHHVCQFLHGDELRDLQFVGHALRIAFFLASAEAFAVVAAKFLAFFLTTTRQAGHCGLDFFFDFALAYLLRAAGSGL